MKLNGPERPGPVSMVELVANRAIEWVRGWVIKPPTTAESIRHRSPWEFPVPDSLDEPRWLGFNRDGDGAKKCMGSITGPSKDVSNATDQPTK